MGFGEKRFNPSPAQKEAKELEDAVMSGNKEKAASIREEQAASVMVDMSQASKQNLQESFKKDEQDDETVVKPSMEEEGMKEAA